MAKSIGSMLGSPISGNSQIPILNRPSIIFMIPVIFKALPSFVYIGLCGGFPGRNACTWTSSSSWASRGPSAAAREASTAWLAAPKPSSGGWTPRTTRSTATSFCNTPPLNFLDSYCTYSIKHSTILKVSTSILLGIGEVRPDPAHWHP